MLLSLRHPADAGQGRGWSARKRRHVRGHRGRYGPARKRSRPRSNYQGGLAHAGGFAAEQSERLVLASASETSLSTTARRKPALSPRWFSSFGLGDSPHRHRLTAGIARQPPAAQPSTTWRRDQHRDPSANENTMSMSCLFSRHGQSSGSAATVARISALSSGTPCRRARRGAAHAGGRRWRGDLDQTRFRRADCRCARYITSVRWKRARISTISSTHQGIGADQTHSARPLRAFGDGKPDVSSCVRSRNHGLSERCARARAAPACRLRAR